MKSINILSSLHIAAAILLTSMSNAHAESFDSLVIGAWVEVVDKQGHEVFYNIYYPNHRHHMFGYIQEPDHSIIYQNHDGRWYIEGEQVCIVTESANTSHYTVGEHRCYKIVEINDLQYTYLHDGRPITMIRISDGLQPPPVQVTSRLSEIAKDLR